MTQLTIAARNVPNFGTTDERLKHEGWELALVGGYHRDSDVLDVANAQEVRARLEVVDPEMTAWDTLSANHWAVGWYEHLIVDPSHEGVMGVLRNVREALDSYPILNEDRWSALEVEWHFDERCGEGCGLCESERERRLDKVADHLLQGKCRAFTSVGGYSLVYSTEHGETLCAACATKALTELHKSPAVGADVYWEGPPLECDDCGDDIASAYGDPNDAPDVDDDR